MSIEAYVKQARFAYYNGHPIIPDEMYDALVERANILAANIKSDNPYR